MQNVRRLILYLASAIGVWLLVSFGGAMLNSGNAAFWSNSLMWALLSCLIVAPGLLLANDVFTRSQQPADHESATSPSTDAQKPFVEEESDQVRTLWPEPEQTNEWPPEEEVKRQRQRVHA